MAEQGRAGFLFFFSSSYLLTTVRSSAKRKEAKSGITCWKGGRGLSCASETRSEITLDATIRILQWELAQRRAECKLKLGLLLSLPHTHARAVTRRAPLSRPGARFSAKPPHRLPVLVCPLNKEGGYIASPLPASKRDRNPQRQTDNLHSTSHRTDHGLPTVFSVLPFCACVAASVFCASLAPSFLVFAVTPPSPVFTAQSIYTCISVQLFQPFFFYLVSIPSFFFFFRMTKKQKPHRTFCPRSRFLSRGGCANYVSPPPA